MTGKEVERRSAAVPATEEVLVGVIVQEPEAALDEIAEMLRDPDWGVGMLEDIADIVRRAGRSVENYPDERPTWGRH